MAYGLQFFNDDGVRVVGKEEDNLKFIGKITTYSANVYGCNGCYNMRYLTFSVTSSEFPIVYLYVPYDDVGTCSNPAYTDSTTCVKNDAGWTWTNSDEINMAAVHSIKNISGNNWEVYVRCGWGGYPKNACLYVFNKAGTTASTDLWGIRVYKSNGTDLAYDSGFEPLMSRWGAEFPSNLAPSGAVSIAEKTFASGEYWSTNGVTKPSFGCSSQDMAFCTWSLWGTHWIRYFRSFFTPISNGVAKWYAPASAGGSACYGTPDTLLGSTPPVGTAGAWYYHGGLTLPFIDGADYD